MTSVLVSSGCPNKIHTLGGLNNRNLLLAVLEAEICEIKVSVDLIPGRGALADLQTAAI